MYHQLTFDRINLHFNQRPSVVLKHYNMTFSVMVLDQPVYWFHLGYYQFYLWVVMQKSFLHLKTCLCLLDEKKACEIMLSWLPFHKKQSENKFKILDSPCFKQVNISVVWVNSCRLRS